MKALALVVIALFAIPIHGQEKSPKPADQGNIANNAANSSLNTDKPETDGQKNAPQQDSECYFMRLLEPTTLIQIGLLIVAIFAVKAANKTLVEIKRQADEIAGQKTIMGGQLTAMQNQLTQMENAERPWLFLVPHDKSYHGQPTETLHWKIVNRGRTTAQVSRVLVRCKVLRGIGKILKNPPNYEEGLNLQIDFSDIPIAPNGEIEGSSLVEGDNLRVVRITEKDVIDIQSGVADLVIFGRILYKNQTRPLESRFCYRYASKFQDFRTNFDAESEYHQCT